MDTQQRRAALRRYFDSALAAVNPEALTREALTGSGERRVSIVALGKAAAAMCRGASQALGEVDGVCVTDTPGQVPDGIELVIGDHPVPGNRSFRAGTRVLDYVRRVEGEIIALVSGGGSALCEHPIDDIAPEVIVDINRSLLAVGASIAEINLVRRHFSAIKGGGLVRAAGRPIDTYAISDVCGADPAVIASGPTIPIGRDPEAVLEVLDRYGLSLGAEASDALARALDPPDLRGDISILADGHTAAHALVAAATLDDVRAVTLDGWVAGDVGPALDSFIEGSGPGITVAAGEPEVSVMGDGLGGRNTHTALLAAMRLAGTEWVFGALATDGVDGNSRSAGAIVDGSTVSLGGDPLPALRRSDSATYLRETGDLLATGSTGTNVADLWSIWKE